MRVNPYLIMMPMLLAACTDDNPKPAGETALAIEQVADGIYVHAGQHEPIDSASSDDIANIGFIVGEECVAVVDTGGSIRIGQALRDTVEAVTDIPVCYVINTHVHYDHLLGNLPFEGDSVTFIGHGELGDAVNANREFFVEQFSEYMGETPERAVVAPDRGVSDQLSLNLGGRTIDLKAWPSGHTHNDLTVYDPQTRTLWAGDLVFMERIPALDASLRGWLAIMDELRSVPAQRVIPGHGPAVAEWPDALDDQARYLNTLLEETREAIASGQFLDEAMDKVAAEEAARWQLHEQHHRRNISRAYRELEWE